MLKLVLGLEKKKGCLERTLTFRWNEPSRSITRATWNLRCALRAHYFNLLLLVGQLSQLHKMLLCFFVHCIQFVNFLSWAHTNSQAMHIPQAAILSWVQNQTGREWAAGKEPDILSAWRKSVPLSVTGTTPTLLSRFFYGKISPSGYSSGRSHSWLVLVKSVGPAQRFA
jgi:hypothetical protein